MIESPYLLFLGQAKLPLDCKSARGMVEWRSELCVAECALDGCEQTVGLQRCTPSAARALGVRTLVIGTVSAGGMLPVSWLPLLLEAIEAGLNIVSGMHQFLNDQPELTAAAEQARVALIDVRNPTLWQDHFNEGGAWMVATGQPRAGTRLLTVGTDCSTGKMYTALALERELTERGKDVEFKATGQTGIFIAGNGIPVDAMVADFIAGSVEALSPADPGRIHVIEGQGSLHHPAFAGVSLGLLHGAQPDYLVVCHEPTRSHMRHLPHVVLPSLEETVKLNLLHARRTNPAVEVLGFSINTQHMDEKAAHQLLKDISAQHGLPATDPSRTGLGQLIDRLPATETESL